MHLARWPAPSFRLMSDKLLTVRNIASGPVSTSTGAMLAAQERGRCPDDEHTRSQIAAGLLIEIAATKTAKTEEN